MLAAVWGCLSISYRLFRMCGSRVGEPAQKVKIQDITEMLSWPRNRLYDEGTAAVAENLSPSVLGLK